MSLKGNIQSVVSYFKNLINRMFVIWQNARSAIHKPVVVGHTIFTARRAQITLYFSDHTSDNMLRVKKAAYDFFNDHPMETKNGKFLLAGGFIGLQIALNEEMKRTHVLIDSSVFLA